MKKIYILLLFLFSIIEGFSQCPIIDGAMVASCGTTEGNNEFIIFTTTAALPISSYTLYYGSNNPATNSPTARLFGANASLKTGSGSVTASGGCTIITVTSPSTVVPANSSVIFIPKDLDQAYDVTGLCNGTLYVAYIDRYNNGTEAWKISGNFANGASAARYAQITTTSSACNSSSNIRSYTNSWSSSAKGNFVWWSSTGTPTYVNNGCTTITPPVTSVDITPGSIASVCAGSTSTTMNFTTAGNPNTYSLTWNASALTAGFTNISNATLGATPLTISVPVTASATTYTASIIVTNSTISSSSTAKNITVTITAKPAVIITNPAAACFPATVDITANSITTGSSTGLSYSYFSDAAGTTVLSNPATVATSGTYYIKGTNSGGCFDIKPVTVVINAKPSLIITTPAPACAPATVDITGNSITSGSTAGLNYSYFSDAAGTIAIANQTAITSSGTYYIKGTNNTTGCFDIKPVIVTINPKPTLVVNNPAAVCSPATVNITDAAITNGSSAGLSYSYFSDQSATSALLTPSAITISGTYYIKATNTSTGCFDIKPVTVTINIPQAKPTITGDNKLCVNANIILQSSTTNGSWISNNPAVATIDNSGKITGISAGTTTITYSITDCGIINSDPFTITVEALTAITEITGNNTVKAGETIQLVNITPGGTWSLDNAVIATINPLNGILSGITEGSVKITYSINTNCGVITSSPFLVKVVGSDDLFVPNAFTPNGDNNNDTFRVYGTEIKELELNIFNQWGELIFITKDKNTVWDGSYKNVPQPVGVYVYSLKAIMLNGTIKNKKGSIELIR